MYLRECRIFCYKRDLIEDIAKIIADHSAIKDWAYILHDKDCVDSHYHIYLNFGANIVDTKEVAKWFGLKDWSVERIRGSYVGYLLYFVHAFQKQKFQYSLDEVVSSFDYIKILKSVPKT